MKILSSVKRRRYFLPYSTKYFCSNSVRTIMCKKKKEKKKKGSCSDSTVYLLNLVGSVEEKEMVEA